MEVVSRYVADLAGLFMKLNPQMPLPLACAIVGFVAATIIWVTIF